MGDKIGTDYVWPSTLRLPERPPKLVYLDLLHWIRLAQANCGHPEGKAYQGTLQACVSAVAEGKAVFPLCASLYMEIAKIGQYRQRRDLREVIELVSGFRVVAARDWIARLEVEALLDEVAGPRPQEINPIAYLDWGVARAFGKIGGFHFIDDATGMDVTAEARLKHPDGPEAFDRKMVEAELLLNRRTIDGPAGQDEEDKLRALGWEPRAAYQVMLQRAAQELEQVERFDTYPAWRIHDLRAVIIAREISIEINEHLAAALDARGVELEQVFPEVEETRRAFSQMPSFDVSVSLKTAYHRDPRHHWTPNDIQDIDALASTVPYCDIVATDRQAASHLVQSGVAGRFGTAVIARLHDLPALLNS
jgi:hypothetical protein